MSGGDERGGGQPVTCVICLEEFDWDGSRVFRRNAQGIPEPVTLPARESLRWSAEAKGTIIRCPNRIGDDAHYFPVGFVLNDRPIVIGLVGNSSAGKTCLLAAMSGEIDRQRLGPRGLQTVPVNLTEHSQYRTAVVDPFYTRGIAPPHTNITDLVRYADSVLLTSYSGHSFPLVFFDAAGEQLKGLHGDEVALRFLHRVDGLIFVADPTLALDSARRGNDSGIIDDPTYAATIAGLRDRPSEAHRRRLSIPAALAITKSDLLRFEPPVDQWLSRPAPSVLDVELLHRESRDAYAFLYQRRATAWLSPVDQFEQCSLHFVSASGSSFIQPAGDGELGRFARPARPRRVLEPLVTLLAALGRIDDHFVRGS
ncbi:hypothetical protein FRACA_630003 [Frankia canadensis]|uniref:Double-GTPase 2 domain-containing protein n=1 Tax=Frankia canadensis TaxID=1836972 RepID=A0A2I2KZW1_9ACTN|nr:GTPase domain-containing protein [Frankia canadensis]SNQ51187.1 hypothetical protein FRACA_630003 [Frankia canadensis]SOU58477.1 hypothetical protein FRACA_630003 [Frankia canadensis]